MSDKTRQMSTGEMAIWAAAFATSYKDAVRTPPAHALSGDWNAWEIEQATVAAEGAAYAVLRARECVGEAVDGFGEDSVTVHFLRQIVGEEGKP